ncbi:TBC1 domain family member 1 isoform X2 [Macrosteles quadrilineatus]|uniref:TBC1 domain family member 1 isoform X2 n=1 Tax=Macrosteles quadrilineatus TaxID=74068 RepID=UPI0023E20221|nr:TBC1 domain family member 1 isoform X2 [Macrosteles quadrilineatus]
MAVELFAAMKDQATRVPPPTRTLSNAATLTSLCADISPSSSHFFEVLYIGKVRVSQKKISTDTFIDDTLDKFKNYELEKEKKNALQTAKEEEASSSQEEDVKEQSPSISESSSSPNLALVTTSQDNTQVVETTKADTSETQGLVMRLRSGSVGSVPQINVKKSDSGVNNTTKVEDNRTMVFQVGHYDLRLISPDRKQVLLHKQLKDIVYCVQGNKHHAHFGFICRESGLDYHVGYVFKCESDSVADDVVGAISQAHITACEAVRKEKQPVLSCEHCPMVWYHKLCAEIESQTSDKRVQSTIFRRLELLPEEEQEVVLTKLRGAEALSDTSVKEQNELLMMLLRAHCESKQSRHVHDTAENRHEFLNHMLGSSTIFMKAKRSLTSSFDQLLKRKGSKDDLAHSDLPVKNTMVKELSLPMNAALCKDSNNSSSMTHSASSGLLEVPQTPTRTRSSTVGSLPDTGDTPDTPKSSPMMNIFLKVGHNTSPKDEIETPGRQAGSWRQAIFNTVVTPSKNLQENRALDSLSKRDKADLRALWRKAINQQVLLIRMEKENARLKASQEEATMKRIKLEYDDIGALGRQNLEVWEMIINKEARKADERILTQAIRQGVPRSKRGEVWLYLAERHCAQMPPFDCSKFPNYNVHYEDLLKQLTSQQHAILIDLGRTFPNHTYFSSPLGPGQLALYNLLKAYSLLDPEVGYCQGLSFVAGVLLLHMTEDQAFFMLRHLMFRRGMRAQYLPDMIALQVQLYQLSRLIHDHQPDLYAQLDKHEVAPTLFAAPWMLTMFASQFPLGFVTRVFDLLFLEGKEVLFRVAMALLSHHKEGLLNCDNFEQIMNYFKTNFPKIDKPIMDKVLKEVFYSDISKKLLEYEVEYHVLQEEVNTPRPEVKRIKELEEANKQLHIQNRCLSEQLEISTSNINRLETSRSSHMMQINRLESQVRSLEVTVSTLGDFITTLAYNNTDLEIPGEILRIIAQIHVSERKSLPNNVLRPGILNRNMPLKTIDDNRISPQKDTKKSPRPLKSTLSSPNLEPKTSFFAHSFNQINQQKLGISDKTSPLNGMKQSRSDSSSVKQLLYSESKEIIGEIETEKPRLGRVLTDNDRKALGLVDSDSFVKTNSMPSTDGKRKILKSSQSSYELGKSESVSAVSDLLPLNSDTVNICFGGTTKLRQIRPLKVRNESCSSIPSQSSSTGSLFEGCPLPNKKIELQIVEPSDISCTSRSVFEEKADNSLFSEKHLRQNSFEKSRGKEAEEMIKSQVPAKQPSLLT